MNFRVSICVGLIFVILIVLRYKCLFILPLPFFFIFVFFTSKLFLTKKVKKVNGKVYLVSSKILYEEILENVAREYFVPRVPRSGIHKSE